MVSNDASDALSAQERRESNRKKLIVDVNFEGNNSTGIANTRDIGIGGLYIKTETVLATGDEILMRMSLGGEDFHVKGVIAYADKGLGVGVRFRDLTRDQIATLRNELGMD